MASFQPETNTLLFRFSPRRLASARRVMHIPALRITLASAIRRSAMEIAIFFSSRATAALCATLSTSARSPIFLRKSLQSTSCRMQNWLKEHGAARLSSALNSLITSGQSSAVRRFEVFNFAAVTQKVLPATVPVQRRGAIPRRTHADDRQNRVRHVEGRHPQDGLSSVSAAPCSVRPLVGESRIRRSGIRVPSQPSICERGGRKPFAADRSGHGRTVSPATRQSPSTLRSRSSYSAASASWLMRR